MGESGSDINKDSEEYEKFGRELIEVLESFKLPFESPDIQKFADEKVSKIKSILRERNLKKLIKDEADEEA